MARQHAIIFEESFQIPVDALTFEGFRQWVHSPDFPETGRIDYLDGDIGVYRAPEDLHTHGIVKISIAAALHDLVTGSDVGEAFVSRTRVVSRFASLSVEPDIVVILWKSLQEGRVRYVPSSSEEPDRYIEMEGAPDLVVEVVSKSSQHKDTKRLPLLYARAGIPELWIADVRRGDIRFQIHTLADGAYVRVEPDADGWVHSPRLGLLFRLTRHATPVSSWYYQLEHQEERL